MVQCTGVYHTKSCLNDCTNDGNSSGSVSCNFVRMKCKFFEIFVSFGQVERDDAIFNSKKVFL